ncbi:hypothetical protein BJY01DRAFT_230672 [Aspergillus pseudoustus]|uniref:Uncharacterized protein n=1 Tax=Aspergillus pseudoustus TaxID=1810923 RepID=A0ABR4L1R6_9EURO
MATLFKVLFVASLWLWQAVAEPASTNFQDLVLVPRHVWDESLTKRADDATDIGLADHETFVWASGDKPGEKAVVVSMVAYSKQNEKILDMDKFSFALETASCNADEFSLRFKHPLIYQAAKLAWNWVNYNELRSFVIVPSWKGCGDDRSHDPWVVRKVTFDDKSHKVVLDATSSTWKKVMNTFVLDFGEVVLGNNNNNHKRDLIPDLDKKFTLDVSSSFPEEIFSWEIETGVLNATLQANCNDCGTEGALVFAGHVEASLGWTGIDIDRFEISVKPQGVKAHVGVSLEFQGEVDFREFIQPSEEFTLLDIPISGWRIPKVFEFGPHIEINAGYVIDYIGGSAVFSTGITATIPDTAIAKLDLKAEDSVQVSGWTPEIETDPLVLRAQIDAQTRLYTEIALSVSMTILEDNGFGVDLSLKVPQLTVTTSGGVDGSGFCEPGGEVFGVKIDSTVGVNLALEGWGEVDGDRVTLADVTLVDAPDLFTFPQVCVAWGGLSEGYCLAEEAEEEKDDDEAESNSTTTTKKKRAAPPTETTDSDLTATRTRSEIAHYLAPRQSASDRDYTLSCDTAGDHRFFALNYPGPRDVRENTKVPIIKPLVSCSDTAKDCVPDTGIEVVTTNMTDRAVVRRDNGSRKEPRRWATEHIYEANWIKEYLDYVQKNWTGSAEGTCDTRLLQVFDPNKSPDPAKVPIPAKAQDPQTYQESLMQNLGTVYTVEERMVLLPMKQNNLKFAMFAQNELIGYFEATESKHQSKSRGKYTIENNHFRRTCDITRIITTCRYYDNAEVQARLQKTIVPIEAVLKAMDEDPQIEQPPGFSFEQAHKDWYKETYEGGIEWTRGRLQSYAKFMVANTTGMAELPAKVQTQIRELTDASNLKRYCPDTERKGW